MVMLRPMTAAWVCMAVVLLATTAANAHHSFSMYDQKKMSTFEGTIARFQWTNPHSFVDVDVETKDGVTRYAFEAPNNGWLKKYGWTRTSLKPGDHIKLTAWPLRDGRPGGALIEVLFADGRKLDAGWGALSKENEDRARGTPKTTAP